MTLGETLISAWQQALIEERGAVELAGEQYLVVRLRAKRLRTVRIAYGQYQIDGIEQNPRTTSRWAALAREGKRIMQFAFQGRYVGNVCEGELMRYPGWNQACLPE